MCVDDPFCFCDLDPITLVHKSDLDSLKMYLHTKVEVSKSRFSKVTAQTGQITRARSIRDRNALPCCTGGDN